MAFGVAENEQQHPHYQLFVRLPFLAWGEGLALLSDACDEQPLTYGQWNEEISSSIGRQFFGKLHFLASLPAF